MIELIRFLATLCTAGAVKENVLVLARDGTAAGRGAEGRVVGSWAGLGSVVERAERGRLREQRLDERCRGSLCSAAECRRERCSSLVGTCVDGEERLA